MRRSALIVIDVLNEFFERPPLSERREAVARNINQLVRLFREHHHPIIWVRQEFRPDLSDAFLDMRKTGVRVTIEGTEGARILGELDQRPADTVIVKRRYSAFFDTPLDDILRAARPDVLVIGGVNTHACVRTTVIDAYQRDYEVVVASDCTTSYDDAHHEVTRRYLDGRIASFLSNPEIHALIAEEATNDAAGAS